LDLGPPASYLSTNLVSDLPGLAQLTDPNLINPWGVSFSATSPFWVANQGTGTSTLYAGDSNGDPLTIIPLVVTIPRAPGGDTGPTGTVRNDTTDFRLSNGDPASFLFASLDGVITGWNTGTLAEITATVPDAVYTGLANGSNASGNFLYAANVGPAQGRIDVFDGNWALTTLSGSFQDPNLTGFSPFNVQNLNGTLYVAFYSPADPDHGGVVDAFDTDGHFLRRVASDHLNAPWGVALAPADFGPFSNDLLVGNFGLGDGRISAFNPDTGAFLGYVTDASGNPLAFEGLWALAFGNGVNGGDRNALYFTAGINAEQNGLFGSIRAVSPGPQQDATALLATALPAQPAFLSAPATTSMAAVTPSRGVAGLDHVFGLIAKNELRFDGPGPHHQAVDGQGDGWSGLAREGRLLADPLAP
jgi:uncharacterized protein (TIGR03118 family)